MGSIDEDAIHYLMTRGIKLSVAKKLLINGFLSEIFENISEEKKLKIFFKKVWRVILMEFKNIKSKFPIFKQKINGKPLIYLDSATPHKPKIVIDEMSRFL